MEIVNQALVNQAKHLCCGRSSHRIKICAQIEYIFKLPLRGYFQSLTSVLKSTCHSCIFRWCHVARNVNIADIRSGAYVGVKPGGGRATF